MADDEAARNDNVIPISGRPGDARARCGAETLEGRPCRNYAVDGGLCRVHADKGSDEGPDAGFGEGADAGGVAGSDRARPGARREAAARTLRGVAAFLRRRIDGTYSVDPYGFDEDLTTTVLLPLMAPFYHHWFRVRSEGADRIPEGGAMIVGNHAGTVPVDALMVRYDVYEQTGRHARELAADLALRLPVVGHVTRKLGATLACREDAERLLAAGELLAVWPEGYKGVGKPFRDRYRLRRFGRGGFVSMALRQQVPIVPCAIVGSEEIYPLLYNLKPLARMLGFPYFPVIPQMALLPVLGPLALLPLPSRWVIEYGEPIDTTAYGPQAAEDPMTVFDLTDRVRSTIQTMLDRMLEQRTSVF